jgi:hypothetical protein
MIAEQAFDSSDEPRPLPGQADDPVCRRMVAVKPKGSNYRIRPRSTSAVRQIMHPSALDRDAFAALSCAEQAGVSGG